MKKLLALMLVALMLVPMFVACQDSTKQPSVTTDGGTKAPGETADPFEDNVPDLDFNERLFMIAAPETWGNTYFDREELTDETINDAIYTRNRYLEERFNITINSMNLGMTHEQASAFQTFALAGEDVIDLIGVATYQSGQPMITEGLALPWNGVEYINLDQPWWHKSVTETLAILDNYYYLSGDINYAYMGNMMCMYFNKKVAEDYSETVGDLYQLVRDGKWTWDAFNSMVKVITSENGDGTWNELDTYGHLQYYHSMEAWTYGANYKTIVMSEEGPKMNFYTQKMQNIVNQVYNMIYTDKYSYMTDNQEILNSIFFDSRALFMTNTLGCANSYRQFDTDFGILPNPKYDESQKGYYSYSDQWGLVMCLPYTATDTARTGAVLEALCAQSMKLVRTAFYDKSLIGKGIRDDESEEMLNILFDGMLYDMGITFCTNLDYIPLRSLINAGNNGLASWWRNKEKKITKNFEELFDYVKSVKEGTVA